MTSKRGPGFSLVDWDVREPSLNFFLYGIVAFVIDLRAAEIDDEGGIRIDCFAGNCLTELEI